MRVPNDPDSSPGGAFAELFRLQTEFQAKLAEETIRYLRRLQGAGMPAAPGTVLRPDEAAQLRADGAPGGSVTLDVEVENRQRVHCIVTPMLEPLVEASGVTWFPDVEASPGSTLVAPNDVRAISLSVRVPADLPPGTYRGALLLQGFRDGAVPVTVSVKRPTATRSRRGEARAKRPPARRRTTRRS